jgi:hypothetical protein
MATGTRDTPAFIRWIIVLLIALVAMGYLAAASSNYQSCLFEAQMVGGDDKFADDCSRWNPFPF